MFEFSSYHVLLSALGVAIILAYWIPRFLSGREPAASALLIGLGWLIFGWIPGMPEALSPIAAPKPWKILSELCVIAGLFGVGLRIDRLANFRRWSPTLRLLAIAMPLTILSVALMGWTLGGMTLAGGLLLGSVLAPTDPVLAGDVQVGRPTEGGDQDYATIIKRLDEASFLTPAQRRGIYYDNAARFLRFDGATIASDYRR